ncbi:hypothetical protein AWB74_05295 [Caballeronia arvi]|uniref:Uncharacterized protein n=1 Tax=Caballeronia arvi TaxID=1777135 RepID=A0A158KBS6_9BURK|nr:hypothetical protein AWB74_05295 [Caballeronia arvi]
MWRDSPPATRHAPAWRGADARCALHVQRMHLLCAANAAHQKILPCATFAPGAAVYIQCTSKKPACNPLCARIVRDAQRCTNYLQKPGNVFRQFVIRAGYHAASSFRQTSKVPAIKTRRKSPLGTQSARVSRLLCCPTVSCPLLVAHAPHKVAGVQRAGIFLSLQGNDMAKCQRTKLDTARSLYSAFCSAGMLYFEQCMT